MSKLVKRVTVNGMSKGIAAKERGRWHWYRNNSGVDTFPRSATKADILAFIARVCLTTTDKVTLIKE